MSDTITATVDLALFYAKKGWRVFPIKAKDKTPLVDAWDEQATTDENKILGWWEYYPDANIGIATGAKSGIVVLDIDGDEGEKSFTLLMKEHNQPMPVTPTANTGKGRHIFYEYEDGLRNTSKKLGAGLDTRGEGGYVVVPPSVHPSGKRYTWAILPSKTSVVRMPEWMVKALVNGSQPVEATPAPDGAFPAGMRNDSLTRMGGALRRKGLGFESILAALLQENRAKCVPPLPEMEVRQIALSVSRYTAPEEPLMEVRDRLTAEWGFCHSIYVAPDYAKEFAWVSPDMFSDEKLSNFWSDVCAGVEPVTAATKQGILADLEKFDADVFKVDGYARQIEHFAYIDDIDKFGWLLQQAAKTGDYEKIGHVIQKVSSVAVPQTTKVVSLADVASEVEAEIRERAAHPTDVWGIPYSPDKVRGWTALSKLTGGKQPGELIMIAGEPGVGKSWWTLQDAMFTAVTKEIPVFVWSGEMKRKQVLRRMYAILGVNYHNMRTGNMTEEDWNLLADAKALVLNSPIYIYDQPGIALHDLKAAILREKQEHGIQQFLVDYAYLIDAPGDTETERTAYVSRDMKILASEGDGLAGVLIASVTKLVMDTDKALMGGMRGSGQQSHDADIIYFLTKFAPMDNDIVKTRYMPEDYSKLATLHFVKGRELDASLPGGRMHFARVGKTPAFQEELQVQS